MTGNTLGQNTVTRQINRTCRTQRSRPSLRKLAETTWHGAENPLSNVCVTQNVTRKTKVIFNSKPMIAYKRSLHSEGDKIFMIHVDKKPFVHTIAMLSDSINVNLPPKCV